jgi:AcrR family transcriptional regulator
MARLKERPPRRLPPAARREQLVRAATSVIAEQGYAGFSLDDVAARADVTRNLLYHYFPRGRIDLFLAALDGAGTALLENWAVDEDVPVADRTRANFARVADHVMSESDSWLVYRQARGLADPDVESLLRRQTDALVARVFLNQLGTTDPPPMAAVALRGYVAFAEAALEDAKDRDVAREDVIDLLSTTLGSVGREIGARSGGR